MDYLYEKNIITNIELKGLGEKMRDKYSQSQPFPHGVIDGVFNDDVLDDVISEFDSPKENWHEFDTKYEKKFQQSDDKKLGPTTISVIQYMNSGSFLSFLEDITGIDGLIPDPYLAGGGLHKIEKGGKLGIHVDFNWHAKMRVFRRVNVIVYLNRDWIEDYGGHLELWDESKSCSVKKILPIFNRMVIFNTTEKSYHGHPFPVNCPKDKSRKSLALYYYTANQSGGQSSQSHSTLFIDKNNRSIEIESKKEGILIRLFRLPLAIVKRLKSW